MTNRAVILAGGDGLRLRPLTCTKPKTMLPVCGRPIIGYTIDALRRNGYVCFHCRRQTFKGCHRLS